MTSADAARIAGLCEQQIVALLSEVPISRKDMKIVRDLADLADWYTRAPDLSEMTPQTETYGDGTPGNISATVAPDWDCFRLGETVNLKVSKPHSCPGTVIGFYPDGELRVCWDEEAGIDMCRPAELRHGP